MKNRLFTLLTLFFVSYFLSAQGPATWNQNTAYTHPALVINGTTTYMSLEDVPPNTAITNKAFWVSLDSQVPSVIPSGADSLSTPDASEVENLTVPDTEEPKDENLEKGLIAWYPLDGHALDISGNKRNGVVNGTTSTSNRHGELGKAYSFDGIDDYISISHNKVFNSLPLTLSAWFKSAGNNPQSGIVSKYHSASWNGWQLMEMNDGIVPWYLSGFKPRNAIIGKYGENKAFETEYNKDEWNHAVTVFSKDGGFLYLNGELRDYKDWTGKPQAPTSNYPITIGYYYHSAHGKTGFYNGSIDDVRIYNRILSSNEIHELYILESTDPSDDKDTPPAPPSTGPGKPPADDYLETIAALKKQIEQLATELNEANEEISQKDETIAELQSTNQELADENEDLRGELAEEVEKNDVLTTQIVNLTHDNNNLKYDLEVKTEHLEQAVEMAQVPFINGWVYDNDRGWMFTDADHYPMIYTHKDDTWHFFELGSSDPRYFFNFKSQQWEAWDALPEENDSNLADNNNL